MTRENNRLAVELEAHEAYFAVLERGVRGLPTMGFQAAPSEGKDT